MKKLKLSQLQLHMSLKFSWILSSHILWGSKRGPSLFLTCICHRVGHLIQFLMVRVTARLRETRTWYLFTIPTFIFSSGVFPCDQQLLPLGLEADDSPPAPIRMPLTLLATYKASDTDALHC